MVGQEGHTQQVYEVLTRAGFDPEQDLLQVYALGEAPPGWRRLRWGGLVHDWDLRTNLEGLYVAGQQAFDSCGASAACATGRWAGRRAAEYAVSAASGRISEEQVKRERERVYRPLEQEGRDRLEGARGRHRQDDAGLLRRRADR